MTASNEPCPPWVEFPGFDPTDGFWRQTGEAWFLGVWQPFWSALPDAARAAYLARWPAAPPDWVTFYLDSGFDDFMASTDVD